ncbi:MAG: phosphoribosylaminoimidazolesuccinocarboxamide synthase [Candidatus Methylarchaceae archaeon HK01M]|nr:phosphoribosylaminoimidazolesuccinocarboxamide synthase [Candidatus Methylarchaceae archaeon HK01M]
MHLIKSGKVKDVYELNTKELEFVFSNRISVFDKIIPSEIPKKGETLARTSAYWFEVVKDLGILTHYIGFKPPNQMRVKRVKVINDYSLLSTSTVGYLIPLECVTRYYVYGSLWDRVSQGKIKNQELGFASNHNIRLGEALPQPFFEVTTKLEKVDRKLTTEEALKISGLTLDEYKQLKQLALTIDETIASRVKRGGLIHVDGKKEFAFDENRNLMVVDTFGTADEDRFWDMKEFKKGNYIERSKEYVRQYYRKIGYYDTLMKARREGREEPPIPPLPETIIQQISQLYIELFEDLTGEKFR